LRDRLFTIPTHSRVGHSHRTAITSWLGSKKFDSAHTPSVL
jgi:hypothetical protein